MTVSRGAVYHGGHQYAAVRLPDDKVCAFGNEFSLEYLSDYDDAITSKDLESLPEEKGFAVHGEGAREGELNLRLTYSGDEVRTDYSHMRTWIGHQLLADGYETYRADDVYPLCFEPAGKVSLEDVFAVMRNRFEGTEFSPTRPAAPTCASSGRTRRSACTSRRCIRTFPPR